MSSKCSLQEINPLAVPRGTRLVCELCGGVATLVCTGCRTTFYCGREHAEEDFAGIHSRICQHVATLRTQLSVLGSEEERARRRRQTRELQLSLIDLTRQTALKHLSDGQHSHAIPAALQTLKLSIDVYGQNALELVTAYLLLGELSIGLGKHAQAETYLSSAKWAVLKNPDCPAEIRAALHMNFGKLYAAMARSSASAAAQAGGAEEDKALQHFASAVYYSAIDSGPTSFAACAGYYQLGAVFLAKGATEKAMAMFDMAVDIALDALRSALDIQQQAELEAAGEQRPSPASHRKQQQQQQRGGASGHALASEAAQSECRHMLEAIHEARDQQLGAMSEQAAVSQLGVGMCLLLAGNNSKAEQALTLAYERLSDASGPSSELTELALHCLNTASQRCILSRNAASVGSASEEML